MIYTYSEVEQLTTEFMEKLNYKDSSEIGDNPVSGKSYICSLCVNRRIPTEGVKQESGLNQRFGGSNRKPRRYVVSKKSRGG